MAQKPQDEIVYWFTQPANSFASFYFYDKTTRALVRIRLELGRKAFNGDDGSTGAFYQANRYVGFYQDSNSPDRVSTTDPKKFSISGNGEIVFNGKTTLLTNPQTGFTVCDFSYDGKTPITFVHKGNNVTDKPLLPAGITIDTLKALAEKCMIAKKTITLTKSNVDETALAKSIAAAAK